MRSLSKESAATIVLIVFGLFVTACENEVRFGDPADGLGGGTAATGGAGGTGGSAEQDGGGICQDGATQPCYSADPATLGVGPCAAGVRTCASGQWGACVNEVVPIPEACNGVDDDCDGQIDNGNPGGATPCNTGKDGVCASGTNTCSNGIIVCLQNEQPSSETCDGIDNNCNGAIDDGNPGGGDACDTGLEGECAAGEFKCISGVVICQQTTLPSPEACDDKDNDCDGTIDNDNPGGGASCNTGQPGICAPGTMVCAGGAIWCYPDTFPHSETCNDLDDNCDGQTDEGNPQGGSACVVAGQAGECAKGVVTCAAGTLTCPQLNTSVAEICNDGKDNDCDGTIDNGCASFACDINGAALPLPIALPIETKEGALHFDGDCNIILGGGTTGHVFRIDKTTGAVTTVTSTPITDTVTGVAYRQSDNLIYFTAFGKLYSVPMTGGPPTFVRNMDWSGQPTGMNDIAIGPPATPSAGEIWGGTGGAVCYLNTPTPFSSCWNITGVFRANTVSFSPDGVCLYYTQAMNHTLSAFSTWGPGSPPCIGVSLRYVNGITIDTDGSRMWAMHTDNTLALPTIISEISIPGKIITEVTRSIPFQIGEYTNGILADANDEVFVKASTAMGVQLVKLP